MPSSENSVIIACAGSGKTTRLVTETLSSPDRRIAIVTYTNSNAREISKRFSETNSGVPKHVDVMTWFGFLLRECARPYQRSKYTEKRIASLPFVDQQSAQYSKETETSRHYFANGECIYSDKIAKFAFKCDTESGQRVTSRLRQIYTDVFIDEFQDLAGWDLASNRDALAIGDSNHACWRPQAVYLQDESFAEEQTVSRDQGYESGGKMAEGGIVLTRACDRYT